MKTNFFKVSLIALATATLSVSCSQNEYPIAEQQETPQALKVVTTAQDFSSVDVLSRATEDLGTKVTTFEENDKIGVYVIEPTTSKTIIKNMELTYTDSGWESTTPLYLYKGATYIAYYPYSAELNSLSITSEKDIEDALTAKWNADQSTKEKYEACDAMIASANAPEPGADGSATAIEFSFKHVLSMIELNIPTRKYITTASQGSYKYNAPAPLTLTIAEKDAGEPTTYQLYVPEAGEGDIHRLIVKPGTYTITGQIYDVKGWRPVDFSAEAILEAGKYKGYTLTYTDAPSNERTERDLKVGDYFYSDGSICPHDEEGFTIPGKDNGCIGIIFSLATTEAEKAKGWTHGQVIGLYQNSTYNWVSQLDDAAKTSSTTFTSLETAFSHKDGYSVTQEYISKGYVALGGSDKSFRAMWEILNYHSDNKAIVAPETTSGWYMPAFGQIADVIINLGGINNFNYAYSNNSGNNTAIQTAWTSINQKMTNVGGTALSTAIWTATEITDENQTEVYKKNQAAIADIGDSKLKITAQEKRCADTTVGTNDNKRAVRPVFAF